MLGKKSCEFIALSTVFAVFFGRATSRFVGFGALSGDADSLSEDGNSTELLMESRTGFRIGDTFYSAVYVGCSRLRMFARVVAYLAYKSLVIL